VKSFDDPSIDGCCGTYRTNQCSLVARFVQLEFEDRYRRTASLYDINFIDTYSAGYRKQALVALGGFDESFRTSSVEDQEMSFRAAAQGHRMMFVRDAVVEHVHPASVSQYFKKKFKVGFHKPAAHRRHARRLLADSHTPTSVRIEAALGLCLPLCVTMAPFSVWVRRVMAGILLAITISGAPLTFRNLRRDRTIGLISAPLIGVRAVALGVGVLGGCIVMVSRNIAELHIHAWPPACFALCMKSRARECRKGLPQNPTESSDPKTTTASTLSRPSLVK
jgi:GT2 family glycosyltransferase